MRPKPADSLNLELMRLELLRSYKIRFSRNPECNFSPFGSDGVACYHTDVSAFDVPAIHARVRERIAAILKEIQANQVSQVAILTGAPGMGKSHLINFFRQRKQAEELGYVLVC